MTKELLNTLFVMTENALVRLDGESAVVEVDREKRLQVPMHHLGGIVLFGTAHITAPAMARCAEDGRSVTFLDYGGRFKARVEGPMSGNVLLRLAQFSVATDGSKALPLVRNLVAGKVRNQRHNLLRAARDTKQEEPATRLRTAAEALADHLRSLPEMADIEQVRGVEGVAASVYFEAFGDMIRVSPEDFSFRNRSRRPPRDRTNALLSFLYSMLTNDCRGALEGVGLDPQIGFLHVPRPGRPSLALDLVEEFRPVLADRLALTLINRKQIRPNHFEERDGDSVLLSDEGRRLVVAAFQDRKKESVNHPFLKESAPLGLIPHLQARLLARHLRGDLEHYPPFLMESSR